MHLNTLKPALGSKKDKVRCGRGIASGKGKTCGRGHKGQTSRSGGKIRIGFEGGQMPFQRRVPKFGFTTEKQRISAEIRLHELNKVDADKIDLAALRKANLISSEVKRVKVMLSGELKKSVSLVGISVTSGARKAIEAQGGTVE